MQNAQRDVTATARLFQNAGLKVAFAIPARPKRVGKKWCID